MTDFKLDYDVLVIGAGPSGALVSALLNAKGHRVLVLEKHGLWLVDPCIFYPVVRPHSHA